jgi:hypothetical protein
MALLGLPFLFHAFPRDHPSLVDLQGATSLGHPWRIPDSQYTAHILTVTKLVMSCKATTPLTETLPCGLHAGQQMMILHLHRNVIKHRALLEERIVPWTGRSEVHLYHHHSF